MAVDLEMAVLVPLSLLLARPLNARQLGDETARDLGVRLQSTQLLTPVRRSPRPAVEARR